MKKIFRPLVIASALGVLGVAGIASTGVANAVSGQGHGAVSDIVDKIASTFNLDKAKVQQVFDEQRAEHKQHHQEMMSNRLQQLVDNGTITSEQKTAIESKLTELKNQHAADRESFKDLTPEQRRQKLKQKRAELEQWAKDQGIDLSKLRGVFPGYGMQGRPDGHGPRGHHMM